MRELVARRLHLLGRAGHDGNVIGPAAVLRVLRGVFVAQDRGKHLHGGLAGGDIVQVLGILLLQILDPRRAAGGEHREGTAVGKALLELLGLGDRGEVRAEVRVVHLVDAHELERGDELVEHVLAGGDAERFADRDADGGRDLDDRAQLGIVDGAPGLTDLVFDRDGAGGAHRRALAAADAVGLAELASERGADLHLGSAVGEIDDIHALHLFADTHTVAAEDALVRVAHDRIGGVVDLVALARIGKADAAHAELLGKRLQVAVAALFAGRAVAVMRSEQQLEDHAAMLQQTRGVGLDDHAVAGLHRAGRIDLAALILHHAHTARAVGGKVGMVAESRHFDTGLADHGEDVLFAVEGDALTVNDHCSLCHCVKPPLRSRRWRQTGRRPSRRRSGYTC